MEQDEARAPEINILADGRVIERTRMNTGSVREKTVLPGDYEAVPSTKTKDGETLMRATRVTIAPQSR